MKKPTALAPACRFCPTPYRPNKQIQFQGVNVKRFRGVNSIGFSNIQNLLFK